MWIKICYLTNEINIDNNHVENIQTGSYESITVYIKKYLKIPDNIVVIYDFLHYIKYGKHQFFSCHYVPDILYRLVQKEYNTKYTLTYLKDVLSHNLPFVHWLSMIYSIPREPFRIELVYS